MSAANLAFTAAAVGLIVVGVSRTLLVLGLVGRDGDDDGGDGSDSSDGGGRLRGARRHPRGRNARGRHGHVSDSSGPVAAHSAPDEGELWHRGGDGAKRWLEGAGGEGDDSLWEDEGAWDDASAAGQETLYDSGTDA
jgi:hypothetical protein